MHKVIYSQINRSCFIFSLHYLFSRSFCRSLRVSLDSSSRSSTALSYVLLSTCRYECKTSKYFTEETNTLTTYDSSYSIKMDDRTFLNVFPFFTVFLAALGIHVCRLINPHFSKCFSIMYLNCIKVHSNVTSGFSFFFYLCRQVLDNANFKCKHN